MDLRYQPSSFIPCPLCNHKPYLPSNNLTTEEELSDILFQVREALARKQHASETRLVEPCFVCCIVLGIVFCIVLLIIFTAPV